MNEIICGAGGFLGRYLVNYLTTIGKQVTQLPRYHLYTVDSLHNYLKLLQPFRIYYLSAYGNLHGQDDINEMYNAIVKRFLVVLEATKDLDCQGIITTGSTSEYGFVTEPMREDMLIIPNSFYGAAKAAATHLAQAWAIQYNKPVIVYRPASIIGIGEHSIHLIPKIIRSCLKGEGIEFIGGPTHDYINAQDVVRAIVLLLERLNDTKGIYNVGTGIQWSNQQVLEMIEDITGKKANIIGKKELRDFESSEMWVTNSSKLQALGWEPEISLYDSLKEMVTHELA